MASLPPPPLRLLPAGTTSCRVGIAPTENPNLFTTHTPKGFHICGRYGNSVPNIPLVDLNTVFLTQPSKLVLKTLAAMVLLLVLDVLLKRVHVRWTDRECAVSRLPMELRQAGLLGLDPFDESRFNSRSSVATSIVLPKRHKT